MCFYDPKIFEDDDLPNIPKKGIGGCSDSPRVERNKSMTERLTDEKVRLEKRLREINGLLDKLAKNPEVQDVLDELFKVGF